MKQFPKAIAGAFGVAIALALTSSVQASLFDPGFENGAPDQPNPIPLPGGANGGWAVFNGAAFANSAAETGNWGLMCTEAPGQAWNFEAAYQVVSGVSAGQSYTLTADFMTPTGITETGYVPVLLQLTYFDASGTDLGTVQTSPGNAYALQFSPTATWQTGSVTATAPVGAVYVAPYLAMMENGAQTGTDKVYFDNATLTLVPEPAMITLLGMGMAFPLYLIRRRK